MHGLNVLKFADDTKMFRRANNDGDTQHLQSDLDKLIKWSEKLCFMLLVAKYYVF